MGMGESNHDRVDLAYTLHKLEACSIPINFLDPRPGTPLEKITMITPLDGLRCLAMYRFVNPAAEIRIAGGREKCLRHLQPLALYPANSLFTEGYLTTPGQGYQNDLVMIQDAGFSIEELHPA